MAASLALHELLSAAIDLADRAGEIIRSVAREGQLHAVEKAKGASSESNPAKFEDPQTIADRRAQILIIDSLRLAFPTLQIVGEEEGVLASPSDPKDLAQQPCLTRFSAAEQAAVAKELQQVATTRVVVFVDPLDATKEFTRGVFEVVTTLIGIAVDCRAHQGGVDGVPVAGVVGCPFLNPGSNVADLNAAGRIVWGCMGLGVHGAELQRTRDTLSVCVTGSRSTPALETALEVIGADEVIRQGGAGNKVLKVVEGTCDVYLMLGPGTKRWDTAAGEALLRAQGGTLCDTNGKSYPYVFAPHTELHNRQGLICIRDPSLLAPMLAAVAQDPRTADITRCPTGEPIDCKQHELAYLLKQEKV